jgi:tetratricopeptide (TPR) repeat protein
LVFERSRGFVGPKAEVDDLAGTVTIRFDAIPETWRGFLEVQLASEKKQRFFKELEPLYERDDSDAARKPNRRRTTGPKLIGIVAHLGPTGIDVDSYVKRNPQRWVLRVASRRALPNDPALLPIPFAPYAELLDDAEAGIDRLAAAERRLADGKVEEACESFRALAASAMDESGEAGVAGNVRDLGALRFADCLSLWGADGEAVALLDQLAGAEASILALAGMRSAEFQGFVLGGDGDGPRAAEVLGIYDRVIAGFVGLVSDEARFRKGRVHYYRGEHAQALATFEGLNAERRESPLAATAELSSRLRTRLLHTEARAGRWLEAARVYMALPGRIGERDPRIDQVGARALREVGLWQRAARVYLALIGVASAAAKTAAAGSAAGGVAQGAASLFGLSPEGPLSEGSLMLALAETYSDGGDTHRAEVTLRYVEENFPKRRRDVQRIRAALAVEHRGDRGMATAVADMAPADATSPKKPETQPLDVISQREPGEIAAKAAARALSTEGLPTARAFVEPHASTVSTADLASLIARDLAAAAGDCEALLTRCAALELTPAEDLLLTSSCLLDAGRGLEALVLVEAAQTYAWSELSDPALDELLSTVRTQARFWLDRGMPSAMDAPGQLSRGPRKLPSALKNLAATTTLAAATPSGFESRMGHEEAP